MQQQSSVVAVYNTHVEAEEAVKKLQRGGIDMHSLSIIGKETHTEEHAVGYYNTGDRMKQWGKTGAFWGGLWGMLFGSAFFIIPGIGPLLVAGPLVAWIVGALEGAAVVGGLSENADLKFRTDFFNAFNHPQFSNPNFGQGAIYGLPNFAAGNFGQITSTSVNPRVIQLALKYIF